MIEHHSAKNAVNLAGEQKLGSFLSFMGRGGQWCGAVIMALSRGRPEVLVIGGGMGVIGTAMVGVGTFLHENRSGDRDQKTGFEVVSSAAVMIVAAVGFTPDQMNGQDLAIAGGILLYGAVRTLRVGRQIGEHSVEHQEAKEVLKQTPERLT